MPATNRFTAAIAAVALALGASGCGGGGLSPSAGTDAEALQAVTHDFAVKMLSGDEGTYGYLSQDCRDKVSESEWKASIAIAAVFLRAFGGSTGDPEDLVGEVETRNVTDGTGESRFDLALPATTENGVTVSQGDDWMKWRVEDGEWRVTDCKALLDTDSGGSGSSGGSSDDPASLDFGGAPTEIEIAPSDMFESPTTGTATVMLTDAEEVASPIETGSHGRVRAEGRFFAVRYEVVNNTDAELHQFFDIVTALDATDGETWFDINDGAASDSLSTEREGEGSSDNVEAGATSAAWLVFDVPENAEIIGLGYRPGFFDVTPLSLP